jgi:hypothetical protein
MGFAVVSRAVAGFMGIGWWDLGLIQQPLVAHYAGLEPGELAVGGALGASWHCAARCEQDEGFTGAEGFFVITAPFVEGGEPLVGMAADEAFGDARLVEEDGPLGIAALLRPYGFFVTLHRWLEAAQRVVLRTDSLRLGCLQAEERRGFPGGPGLLAEDASQPPQDQSKYLLTRTRSEYSGVGM